ncbi:hypothetical protein ACIBG7_15180 [Nonomuraea sp. NPDC050328]|uniref:hypothetical protein n=1 Tax=Nonomuraea sp. NPDC050328 TaxID=3364361 RepID=UPI0037875324
MHTAPWRFDLARFDEDPPPVPDPGNQDPEPEPEDLGDKGKRALDAMKAERAAAKREAAAEKKRADELAAKVAEFEDRNKSEAEKLAARAEQAEQRAQAATARAVKAEVKALASDAFADPTDADLLGDLSKYATDDGNVDTVQIKADLDELLERKPHLRKQAGPRTPRPDPSQGSRPGPGPVDFRTVDKATYDAEMAKLGIRAR